MRRETTKYGVVNQVAIAANKREREYLASLNKVKPLSDTSTATMIYVMSLLAGIKAGSPEDTAAWLKFEQFVVSNNLLVVLIGGWLYTGVADIRGRTSKIVGNQRYNSGDRTRTRSEWEHLDKMGDMRRFTEFGDVSQFILGWKRLCSEFTNQDGKPLYNGAVVYCTAAEKANRIAGLVPPPAIVATYLWGFGVR